MRLAAISLALALAGCSSPPGDDDDRRPDGSAPSSEIDAYRPPLPRIDGGPPDPSCGLGDAAFCETFDEPHPGGRGGEIDERRFAFSRWGFSRGEASSLGYRDGQWIDTWSNPDGPPMLCGEQFSGVLPPDDVRVCDGHLSELFNDQGSFPVNSFMVRQAFDFTDRTGTLVFDVDAKRNDGWDGHGWWLEVWISEDPAPIPYHEAPNVGSVPRNAVGFQIAPNGDAFGEVDQNSLGRLEVVRDYQIIHELIFDQEEGQTIRVRDQALNRFRVELSRDRIEIFATDWDQPDQFRSIGSLDDIGLSFSVGYVHFQHAHYNASKTPNCYRLYGDCDDYFDEIAADPNGWFASPTQVYRWDNIGFDGPTLPPVRGYDVPDLLEHPEPIVADGIEFPYVTLGHILRTGQTVEVEGVDLSDALYATFNLIWLSDGPGTVLRYRFNGNAWHEFVHPAQHFHDGPGMVTFTLDAPLDELVPGTNTIELGGEEVWVTNMDLTVHPGR